MEHFCLIVTEDMEDNRIDKCISEAMGDQLSRSFLQKLIKEGRLLVNGKTVKSSYCVKADDEICFDIPAPGPCGLPP